MNDARLDDFEDEANELDKMRVAERVVEERARGLLMALNIVVMVLRRRSMYRYTSLTQESIIHVDL